MSNCESLLLFGHFLPVSLIFKSLAKVLDKLKEPKLLKFILREPWMSNQNSWQSVPINEKPKLSASWWHKMKCQGIAKVRRLHPQGTVDICTTFHGHPSNGRSDIMAWTEVVDQQTDPHRCPSGQTAYETLWIAAFKAMNKILQNCESDQLWVTGCQKWLKSQLLDRVQVGGVGQTFDSAKDKEWTVNRVGRAKQKSFAVAVGWLGTLWKNKV